MKCPNCGITNSLGASQCGYCATPLGDQNDKEYYTSDTSSTLSGMYTVRSEKSRTRPRESEWN